MRELIERFTGRYEIWRGAQRTERAMRNPLVPLAAIAAAVLAFDIWRIMAAQQIDWRAIETNLLMVVFLVFCAWRPRWAWIILLVLGVIGVIESPWVYTAQPHRYPPRVRLISALLCAGIGLGLCAYSLFVRRRYESYRMYHDASPESHERA